MGKSINKKIERLQRDLVRSSPKETISILKLNWIFDTTRDKIILIVLMILGLWKGGELIFRWVF